MDTRKNYNIYTIKMDKLIEQNYICPICGKSLLRNNLQLAHRIGQRAFLRKKYGDEVINHPKNMILVCSLKCNSKADVGNNIMLENEIVQEIQEALKSDKN